MGDPISIGALALSAAGTAVSYMGQRNAAAAAEQEGNYRAQQANINAGQELAASQRRAMEARRQKRLAESTLQARAAGSGAGALDPTVIDLEGDLETEGEFNALNALYEGKDRARTLQMGGTLAKYEGQQAKKAGNMAAIGTVISGVGSMADKYQDMQFKKDFYSKYG